MSGVFGGCWVCIFHQLVNFLMFLYGHIRKLRGIITRVQGLHRGAGSSPAPAPGLTRIRTTQPPGVHSPGKGMKMGWEKSHINWCLRIIQPHRPGNPCSQTAGFPAANPPVEIHTRSTPLLAGAPEKVRQALGAQVPYPSRLGNPDEYASLAMQMITNG